MCCWHTIQDQTSSHCPGLCVLHYRAQILAKKVSARAFKVVPGKTGEAAGEIGIEGTTIEAPTEASAASHAEGLAALLKQWQLQALRERTVTARGLAQLDGYYIGMASP